jgi:hypothetical protein
MKVTILQKFHDKADYMKVYLVGETVTFDDTRAEALIARGLVESAEEAEAIDDEEETPAVEIPAEVIEAEGETEAEEAEDAPEVAEAEEEVKEEPVKAVKPVATKRKKDN